MSKSAQEIAHDIVDELYREGDSTNKTAYSCIPLIAKALIAFRDEAVNEAYDRCRSIAYSVSHKNKDSECSMEGLEIAKEIDALISPAPAKELLFSGQCNHHIPIGQPCSECGR